MATKVTGNGATVVVPPSYKAREWTRLSGLQGISDKTLELHFELYKGYVKHVNLYNEQLTDLLRSLQEGKEDIRFSELKRRLAFEYDGMRLHEFYFDNLTASGSGDAPRGKLRDVLAEGYGDYEIWKRDFTATGTMRGVGWVIAYQDPKTGRISNHWIEMHEDGHLAGFTPILVMDCWEHAYLFDHGSERGEYIEAFFANIDWAMCESRLLLKK